MTSIEEIHPDILIEALRRLDGPSLASALCATSHLRCPSSHPDLWRRLCLSAFPSLRHQPLLNSSPRRLFSDAFPFPSSSPSPSSAHLPDQLISAVDLSHRGTPILSCAFLTDTSTHSSFRSSPFLIDAPSPVSPAVSPEDLVLSWIVIDPAKGRAVNLSSRRAVALGKTVARFATVRDDGWAVGPAVRWRKGGGGVMEVGLTVEDADGVCVSGAEGLGAVKAAMEAERKGKGKGEEEAKRRYLECLEVRRKREKRRDAREWFIDMCCVAASAAVFLSLVVLLIFW